MSTTIEVPITINRIQCKCPKAEVLTSVHRHHFVTCSCGKTFTDGGYDYFRRGGEYIDFSGNYVFLVEVTKNDNNFTTEELLKKVRTDIFFDRFQAEAEIDLSDIHKLEVIKTTGINYRIISWFKQ